MYNSRDEFNENTKRTLQDRVGSRCSNSECGATTSGPNSTDTKATKIGVAAHITAASRNGPRYNPQLSNAQRRSIKNAIWLCQNCAKLVDSDPGRYTVSVLFDWKKKAEDKAEEEIKGGKSKIDLLECPYCGNEVRRGLSVCKGCQAELVYGATDEDIKEAKNISKLLTILSVGALMLIFKKLIGSLLESDPTSNLAIISLIIFIFFIISNAVAENIIQEKLKDKITFFR